MNPSKHALLIGLAAMMLAGLVDRLVRGSWLTLLLAGAAALVMLGLPPLVLALGSALKDRARQRLWADEEGQHHAFGGISMRVVHDDHYSWVDGADLQRVLGTHDREDVLAARLAGHWRRDERKLLMLRVDAVVEYLARMPGRMDPRIVRLRRYFEREVLYPAAQRRARR